MLHDRALPQAVKEGGAHPKASLVVHAGFKNSLLHLQNCLNVNFSQITMIQNLQKHWSKGYLVFYVLVKKVLNAYPRYPWLVMGQMLVPWSQESGCTVCPAEFKGATVCGINIWSCPTAMWKTLLTFSPIIMVLSSTFLTKNGTSKCWIIHKPGSEHQSKSRNSFISSRIHGGEAEAK